MSKAKIFISYRRSDSEESVNFLWALLDGKYPGQVFLDRDMIQPGVKYRRTINEMLSECAVLLAVIGTRWLEAKDQDGALRLFQEDDLLRRELRSGLELGLDVVPVLIGKAHMPEAKDLPQDLRPLTEWNALRWSFDDPRGSSVKLIGVIDRIFAERAERERRAEEQAAREKQIAEEEKRKDEERRREEEARKAQEAAEAAAKTAKEKAEAERRQAEEAKQNAAKARAQEAARKRSEKPKVEWIVTGSGGKELGRVVLKITAGTILLIVTVIGLEVLISKIGSSKTPDQTTSDKNGEQRGGKDSEQKDQKQTAESVKNDTKDKADGTAPIQPHTLVITNGGKTVEDTGAHLLWTRMDYLQSEGHYPAAWLKAMQWADKMNAQKFAGFSDWQVPTVKQYQTLAWVKRYTTFGRNLPTEFTTSATNFWASDQPILGRAAYFDFVSAEVLADSIDPPAGTGRAPDKSVLLVRSTAPTLPYEYDGQKK